MGTDPLLRCFRWDAEGDAALRALSAEDWSRLWALTDAQGGASLLARRLERAGLRAPEDIAPEIDARVLTVAKRNLAMRDAARRAMVAVGKPAMLLKGIDLAERAYGHFGMRPMGDVDFLVRAEDVAAYHAHFAGQGLTSEPHYDPLLVASPNYHHLAYRLPGGGRIELHWRLSDKGGGPDLDGVWARAVVMPLDPAARAMQADDLFLHLCLHLKNHSFDTALVQLWDLAELVSHPTMAPDWGVIRARAEEWQVVEAIAVALRLLDTTLGVRPEVAWPAPPPLALPDMLERLGKFVPSEPIVQARWAALLSRRSSWGERVKGLRTGLMPPRAEIRARYGRAGDGIARDGLGYLRHWQRLMFRQLPRLRRGLPADDRLEQFAALTRYLYRD